jgi:hypothetical protein
MIKLSNKQRKFLKYWYYFRKFYFNYSLYKNVRLSKLLKYQVLLFIILFIKNLIIKFVYDFLKFIEKELFNY